MLILSCFAPPPCSVDYFADLMAVLQQLLGSGALPPPERLRCLLTVAEILRGQVRLGRQQAVGALAVASPCGWEAVKATWGLA